MSSTGIAVGLNKGFPVTKKQVAPRPASRKGVRTAPSFFLLHQRQRRTHGGSERAEAGDSSGMDGWMAIRSNSRSSNSSERARNAEADSNSERASRVSSSRRRLLATATAQPFNPECGAPPRILDARSSNSNSSNSQRTAPEQPLSAAIPLAPSLSPASRRRCNAAASGAMFLRQCADSNALSLVYECDDSAPARRPSSCATSCVRSSA